MPDEDESEGPEDPDDLSVSADPWDDDEADGRRPGG